MTKKLLISCVSAAAIFLTANVSNVEAMLPQDQPARELDDLDRLALNAESAHNLMCLDNIRMMAEHVSNAISAIDQYLAGENAQLEVALAMYNDARRFCLNSQQRFIKSPMIGAAAGMMDYSREPKWLLFDGARIFQEKLMAKFIPIMEGQEFPRAGHLVLFGGTMEIDSLQQHFASLVNGADYYAMEDEWRAVATFLMDCRLRHDLHLFEAPVVAGHPAAEGPEEDYPAAEAQEEHYPAAQEEDYPAAEEHCHAEAAENE